MTFRALFAFSLALYLASAQTPQTDQTRPASAKYPAPLEKMIGQMIIVGFEGQSAKDEWSKLVIRQIKNGEIGGVIIYARNVKDPLQLEALTRALHYSVGSNPPLWIMIDQEGGKIQRLNSKKGFSEYPSAKQIGKGTLNGARAVYRNLACELRGYGINFNLAPVVDLENGESVIASDERSFGSDPIKAAEFAKRFIQAHDSCGILTALKHFPGHGSAKADPHVEQADATGAYEEKELIPFKTLINANLARATMISHVIDRDIDELPASLSRKHIDRLRAAGFIGVIISDDLQMGAITQYFDLNETLVRAINAGDDALIFSNMLTQDPDIPQKALTIVKQAVESGEIDPQKIIDSYKRILVLKKKRLY
ncbi:MAG: glycosyl hydrolase [Helicobacteraceae bacterium]|jgi:beta-N-acetylhexosaminidase|nr:glycosyl hydrolase [Helicobacteraceae bacterium]